MSKEIYTDLEKAFAEDFPNTWGIKELEEIEHKRELNQILESCKHKRSYEELIIGLKNSIKQGYKIIKE